MTDLINLEVAEALRTLRNQYPHEDVQIWVKSSPGHSVLYCAAVGLTTFSSDHETAHSAVEDVIQRFGDSEYRKQAEIRQLQKRLADLGAVACGDNEPAERHEGYGHHQPTV